MNTTRKRGGTQLQPWQIVLFVVAALLILWRVASYTMEVRKARDAKMVQGTERNPAPPGTKTYQMFEEK